MRRGERARGHAHGDKAEGEAGQTQEQRGRDDQAPGEPLAAAQRRGQTGARGGHPQHQRSGAGAHKDHKQRPPHRSGLDQRDPVRSGEQGQRGEGCEPHHRHSQPGGERRGAHPGGSGSRAGAHAATPPRRARSTRQPVQPATSNSARARGKGLGDTTMRAPAGMRSRARGRGAAAAVPRSPRPRGDPSEDGAAQGRPPTRRAGAWTLAHPARSWPTSRRAGAHRQQDRAAALPAEVHHTATPRRARPSSASSSRRAEGSSTISGAESTRRPAAFEHLAAPRHRRQWMRDAEVPSRYGRRPSISHSAIDTFAPRP